MPLYQIPLIVAKPLLKKARKAILAKRKDFKQMIKKSDASKEFKTLNKARDRMYQARDNFAVVKELMKDKKLPKQAKAALQRTMDKVSKGRKKIVTTLMDPKYLLKAKHRKGGIIKYKKGGFTYGS